MFILYFCVKTLKGWRDHLKTVRPASAARPRQPVIVVRRRSASLTFSPGRSDASGLFSRSADLCTNGVIAQILRALTSHQSLGGEGFNELLAARGLTSVFYSSLWHRPVLSDLRARLMSQEAEGTPANLFTCLQQKRERERGRESSSLPKTVPQIPEGSDLSWAQRPCLYFTVGRSLCVWISSHWSPRCLPPLTNLSVSQSWQAGLI